MEEFIMQDWEQFFTGILELWNSNSELRLWAYYILTTIMGFLVNYLLFRPRKIRGEVLTSYAQIPGHQEAQERNKVFQEMVKQGILSPNEIRAHYGLDPLACRGDGPTGTKDVDQFPPGTKVLVTGQSNPEDNGFRIVGEAIKQSVPLTISPLVEKLAGILNSPFYEMLRSSSSNPFTADNKYIHFECKEARVILNFVHFEETLSFHNAHIRDEKGETLVVKSEDLNEAELTHLSHAGKSCDDTITEQRKQERKQKDAQVLHSFLSATPSKFSTEALEKELQYRKENPS
jgi:hypothetical protein